MPCRPCEELVGALSALPSLLTRLGKTLHYPRLQRCVAAPSVHLSLLHLPPHPSPLMVRTDCLINVLIFCPAAA